MTVECKSSVRLATLLRQWFPADQFSIVVRDCDRLVGLVTHTALELGPDDRTAPYVDVSRLAKALCGHVIERSDDSSCIVISGRFDDEPCMVSLALPCVFRHGRPTKQEDWT